ncbi:MAG: Gfo/Idh/MocA family oxidoreductase [Chloroflexota bacterium]|nr:Gfo/Idh/MocA family oxidoreductase [Chloroflexota bacterium]
MAKIGVGFAAIDHWYSAFPAMQNALDNERTQVVAIAHPDEGRLADAASAAGDVTATQDWREVVERDDVQIVVNLASSEKIAEISIAAAEAGKHILSGKPLAMTLDQADGIVEAVRANDVLFMAFDGYGRLGEPNRSFKQWMDEGAIGSPLAATMSLLGRLPMPWRNQEEGYSWWIDPQRAPGGAWIDHAIYQVDTLRYLFGSEVVRISGEIGNLVHKNLGLEDWGRALLRFEGGQIATVEDTWGSPPGGGGALTEIVGTKGMIRTHTRTGKLELLGSFGAEGWIERELPSRGPFTVIDHLLECMDEGKDPVSPVENNRANLAVCLAFYEAAKEHKVVNLGRQWISN